MSARPTSSLAELQAMLQHSIVAPRTQLSPALRSEVESLIDGGSMNSADRIGIYADSYFYRLLGVLKEDYPVVAAIAGDEGFAALATDYLAACPPTKPSIYYAGAGLPAFLRAARPDAWPPYLADLAALERALIEVFHGPDPCAPILTFEALSGFPPAKWPAIALRTIPAMVFLECEWQVGDLKEAAQQAVPVLPASAHQATRYLIWRAQRGITAVYFRALDRAEHAVLNTAVAGTTFGAMCETASTMLPDSADPIAAMGTWLNRWISDELLIGP